MTKEKFLIRELFARIPYGVKVSFKLPDYEEKVFKEHIGDLEDVNKYGGYSVISGGIAYRSLRLDVKPYFRSFSSLTDSEIKEYNELKEDLESGTIKPWKCFKFLSWCYEHHLDINGWIEQELAKKAPKGMYNE